MAEQENERIYRNGQTTKLGEREAEKKASIVLVVKLVDSLRIAASAVFDEINETRSLNLMNRLLFDDWF